MFSAACYPTKPKQFGPPPFTYASVAGLKMWQDYGSLSGSDGDVLSAWNDRSGLGNHLTQATSSQRPILKLSIINGRSVVRFLKTTGQVFNGPNLSALTAGTFFVVNKSNDANPPAATANGMIGTGADAASLHPYVDGTIYDGTGSTARKTCGAAIIDTTVANVMEVVSGPSDYRIYFNGALQFSTATNTFSIGASALVIGEGGAGCGWKGDIGLILVYDSILSAPNRSLVRAKISTEFNIAVTP